MLISVPPFAASAICLNTLLAERLGETPVGHGSIRSAHRTRYTVSARWVTILSQRNARRLGRLI